MIRIKKPVTFVSRDFDGKLVFYSPRKGAVIEEELGDLGEQGIAETAEMTITQNGEYDVSEMAKALVMVE